MKRDADFKFITVADRQLFSAYVDLRRRVYFAQYPGLPDNFGSDDEIDSVSDILIYLVDGKVAGGARLTISNMSNPRVLPLEESGFSLRGYAPLAEFRLDREPYGEISRMGVDPTATDGLKTSWSLGDQLCKRAAQRGLNAVFSICPKAAARLNSMNARRRGVPFQNFGPIPTVIDIPMSLCAFYELLNTYQYSAGEAA